MNRRALLAAALTAAATPAVVAPAWGQEVARPMALTAQDRADLGRIEGYLNGLRTLKARFLQIAPDGATSEGNAWIERPGRMRFEYDPPSPFLLVAGGGNGMFFDKNLNQVSHFPLSQTPLGILLSDNLKLGGDVTVTAITRMPGQIQVTLVRTKSPGDGSITLVFADNPLLLRQWVVLDAQQRETRVSLFNMALGGRFDRKLFETADPRLMQ
jgi:outer membrane lipoprotein-sorting protein